MITDVEREPLGEDIVLVTPEHEICPGCRSAGYDELPQEEITKSKSMMPADFEGLTRKSMVPYEGSVVCGYECCSHGELRPSMAPSRVPTGRIIRLLVVFLPVRECRQRLFDQVRSPEMARICRLRPKLLLSILRLIPLHLAHQPPIHPFHVFPLPLEHQMGQHILHINPPMFRPRLEHRQPTPPLQQLQKHQQSVLISRTKCISYHFHQPRNWSFIIHSQAKLPLRSL